MVNQRGIENSAQTPFLFLNSGAAGTAFLSRLVIKCPAIVTLHFDNYLAFNNLLPVKSLSRLTWLNWPSIGLLESVVGKVGQVFQQALSLSRASRVPASFRQARGGLKMEHDVCSVLGD